MNQEKSTSFPDEIEVEVMKELPGSESEIQFIRAEAYHLTTEVESMKVGNLEEYKKAVEVGIQNKEILRRLEALRKALTMPLDLAKKRIMDQFKKASAIFEANETKITRAIETYQARVKTEPIKTIRTEAGRATITERKDYEIENESLIPDEFWVLDHVRIRRQIVAGVTIPGIKTITVKSTTFATR